MTRTAQVPVKSTQRVDSSISRSTVANLTVYLDERGTGYGVGILESDADEWYETSDEAEAAYETLVRRLGSR